MQAKDQVMLQMLKLNSGQQIAQESMRILIRLEQLLQLHRGESVSHFLLWLKRSKRAELKRIRTN